MKNHNRLRVLLAGILAASTMLGACGGPMDDSPSQQSSAAGNSSTASASASTGGESSSAAGGETNSNLNPLGEFPLVKEKTNITVMMASSGTDFNPETNWFTKFYEDKTNVSVTWNMAPNEQFKEKLNLAFAGGEQIDFVATGNSGYTNISMSNLLKYANQGMIVPLKDLIENDTVYFKQRLDEFEGWRETITTPEGEIYGVPVINECYHCMYYGKMWVNQEFLKNVGLQNPTTLDEFHQMLKAFKEQDANGNGDPNDEIPMMGATDSYGAHVDTYLMSAFIYDDGENRLLIRDGKIVAAFAEPEFQEGLKYLNMLYNEGLIYKESFTQTRETRNKLNSQKYESTAGAIPNIHHGIGNREDGEPARWLEYEPIKPLVGPNGLQTTRYNYYDKFQANNPAGLIPATCKDPQLVMRWLDWFMSDEGTRTLLNGGEGIGWEKADEGAKGVDGSPAVYKTIKREPGEEYYGNVSWGQAFPNFNTAAARLGQQQPDDMMAEDGSGIEAFLYAKSKENYDPYVPDVDTLIPPLFYTEENITEMAQLTTDINTFVEESIARFVIGDMDVNTGWDAYLKELEALGLSRYLEIIQQTYDASSFKK